MPDSSAEKQYTPHHAPMSATPFKAGGRQIMVPASRGFQIAQGEKEQTGTHTSTEEKGGKEKEEEPKAGEIPPAMLLFWNSVVVAALLVTFAVLAKRALQRIPKGIGNVGEAVAEFMNNFTVGIIGPGGEKYTPLVGSIFMYIVGMNLIGLIPGFHSPTANLSITLALGITVFVFVQYVGIRDNGPWGHFKHFMGPMPALAPLMLPVELISELVKPFTLAIRLFGNIFGEDVIIVVLTGLALSISHNPAFGWIPIQFPVLLLSLLTAFVQALVFSMLTCIYISLVSHHDHEGAHGEEGAVEGGHHAHASH